MTNWVSLLDLYHYSRRTRATATIAGDDVGAVIQAAVRRDDVRKRGTRKWSDGRGPIETIPADAIIKVLDNSIWSGHFGGPSWINVEISEDDYFQFVSSFYSNASFTTAEPAKKFDRMDAPETGLPGRPNSKHLILAELKRRIDASEVAATLSAEARYLVEWLTSQPTKHPPSTIKTTENTIRSAFNASKRNPTKTAIK